MSIKSEMDSISPYSQHQNPQPDESTAINLQLLGGGSTIAFDNDSTFHRISLAAHDLYNDDDDLMAEESQLFPQQQPQLQQQLGADHVSNINLSGVTATATVTPLSTSRGPAPSVRTNITIRTDISSDPPPSIDITLLSPRKVQPRAIFVDWIRSIAVYIVVIVHIFVSIRRVTVVSKELDDKIDGSIRSVLQFGMPLFFYLSGRSAAFYKRGFLQFLVDKLRRLLMPCIIGLLIIVIPTCYIGRKYRPCAPRDIDNFFTFYGNYFTSQIACNGLDWYWFLPVLFALTVCNQPYLKWIRDRYPYTRVLYWSRKRDGHAAAYVVCQTLIFFLAGTLGLGIPAGITAMFLMPYWTTAIVLPIIPLIRAHNLMYVVLDLLSTAPSLALALMMQSNFPGDTVFASNSGQFLMVIFYNYFYLEGYIDSVFED
eukprot:PhM_4_TR18098/c0_g3_i3/m.49105